MTTLLLDTHALLWWLAEDERLPTQTRESLEEPETVVLTSAVSAWEISIKTKLGKLEAPEGLLDAAEQTGLSWIDVKPWEAFAAGQLPLHHRDPFDRLLIAQAQARPAMLVSRDTQLDAYGVERVWD